MSQSVIVPPVHDTSPPPFDDDVDENDFAPTVSNEEFWTTAAPISPDALSNDNDDWKSVDDNNETDIAQVQDDFSEAQDQNDEIVPEIKEDLVGDENQYDSSEVQDQNEEEMPETKEVLVGDGNQDDWANFGTFENTTSEVLETPAVAEENNDDWANFESSPVAFPEPVVQSPIVEETKVDDDYDDFGEFTEVQTTTQTPTSSSSTSAVTSEQIESLISTCFPLESVQSSTENEGFLPTELPSFTTYRDSTKQISYFESSLSLWKILSNLSNDPVGIQFQWRKSNSEKLFHQALGVNERFRTKTVPLTPEVLQPEKFKPTGSNATDSDNLTNENKIPAENLRPHFDWKQSGLQDPLAGFDANKSLDLDFYVPPIKSTNETEQVSSPLRNESPIISLQRSSIPIRTSELHPNSTTTSTFNDDAKRIVDSLPNFSFMSAKALMFPIRFNASNNDESTTLY